MKTLRRSISLILSFVMLFNVMPISSFATEFAEEELLATEPCTSEDYADISSARSNTDIPYAVTGGNIYFDPSTGEITRCDAFVREADIPSEINGVAVTAIGDKAFFDLNYLNCVLIPDSVTTIGGSAFMYCPNLTSVNIPNGVTVINDSVFHGCGSLTSVAIPDSVTAIGDYAFFYCENLINVIIPNSVTTIGDWAFTTCSNLTCVIIPNSVISIGGYAFQGCNSLISVTISDGVTTICDRAFYSCDNLTRVTLPDSIVTIGERAFDLCNGLTDVYYGGTEDQWNAINIGAYNDFLTSAMIHYGSTATDEVEPWQYFSFRNSTDDFFGLFDFKNYNAGAFLSYLINIYPQQKKTLKNQEDDKWRGSCYGFAAIEGMVNTDLMDINSIDDDATSLEYVTRPKDDHSVRKLLNYYYLTQYVPALRSDIYYTNTITGKATLQVMAEAVINGKPHMFSYSYTNKNTNSGHAIILEGGQKYADGSYELIGYDNRFHGYEAYRKENSQFVSTGKPVTVSVIIPADFSFCAVFLDKNIYWLGDDGKYYCYGKTNLLEKVLTFELVSDFRHFAEVNPTASTLSTFSLASETLSTLYFFPKEDVETDFVLSNGAGENILDGMDPEDLESSTYIKEYWHIGFGSTLQYLMDPGTGEPYVETVNAPVGLMTTLDHPIEGDTYCFTNLTAGANISYVGREGFVSADVVSAQSVALDLSANAVTIGGNCGNFCVSVAVADDDMIMVAGTADVDSTITVAATEQGLVLDAPAGNYKVSFIDENSNEKVVPVQSTGEQVIVQKPVSIIGVDYEQGALTVTLHGGNGYNTNLLTAFYNAAGAVLHVETEVMQAIAGSHTISATAPEGTVACKVFLLGQNTWTPLCSNFEIAVEVVRPSF